MPLKQLRVLLWALAYLCVRPVEPQDIDLLREQVCYFPDYNLTEEVTQQTINSTAYASGLYIDESSPSRCDGIASTLEVCAQLRNDTDVPGVDLYRLIAYNFRDNGNRLYQQIGDRISLSFRGNTNSIVCETDRLTQDNHEWTVQKGDSHFIAVEILSECSVNRNNNTICPAHAVLSPSPTMPDNTVGYSTEFSDLIPINSLTATPGFVNARAYIVPTPPPLPPSCMLTPPTPVCVKTVLSSTRIIIGEMDSTPDPERRFWGGGTYIMGRIPTNGTAVMISYTALLNTQGNEIFTFRFVVGLMRELPDEYQLLNSMEVEINSAIPSEENTFSSTIHPDSATIPNWQVQEGDQFAVFVYNDCTGDYCPANMNLLSKDDCDSTLYQPFIFPRSRDPGLYNISKNDPYVRKAPVTVNMDIVIDPSTPLETLPLCSSDIAMPTPSISPTIFTTTEEQETDAPGGAGMVGIAIGVTLLGLVLIMAIVLVLIIVIFVLLKQQHRRTKTIEAANVIYEKVPDIAISPTIHVEVNERGRIRRRTMDTQSDLETPRARAFSRIYDYSRVSVVRKSDTANEPPTPPPFHPSKEENETSSSNTYSVLRGEVDKGVLTPTYQSDNADYSTPVFVPADREEDLKTQLARLGIDEIPEDQLQLEEEIGRGQFGTVHKALWAFSISEDNVENGDVRDISAHVAVKVMDRDKSEEDRVRFLQEVVIMAQFNDPNIVGVFGVVTKATKLMMICELMDEDLRTHLTNLRTRIQSNDTMEIATSELPALLLSYCRKIASSFVYLGLKGFIHRDLAARNILVSKEGDCKIADFGMSRDLQDDAYYKSHGGLVPVKWTAPEAILYKKYSTKSDVWSYGCVLYEIWSLGYKPYHDLPNQEVIAKVQKGHRLPPPPGCPRAIYDLMIKCTNPQPESRPTFTNVLVSLQRPDFQLLKWTPEDVATINESARILGAPLEEGECLYTELQNTYIEGAVESYL